MWTENPDRAVGFFPYRHYSYPIRERQDFDNSSSTVSATSNERIWALESIKSVGYPYSLMSDRAVFVHRRFLHSKFYSIAQEVGEGHSCDHFLLSMAVSSESRKPPVGVVSHPSNMRTSNLMLRNRETKSWANARMSKCFTDVMKILGLID